MSDSQAYEEVRVASDGVTVVKRFEEDEFPVPAIAFEFTSERDEAVTVRLQDTVPESVAVEDLGFHPEYGSEFWTIDEDEITFERELEADGDYTTVYGIRATGTDDVEKFLTRPEITEVDPPLPEAEQAAANDGGDDVIPESDDDVVRDVISGESDDVPGLDEESDEEIETLDLKDPNEGSDASSSTAETQTASEEADAESDDDSADADTSTDVDATTVDANSLVTALATELRENEVSAEDVKLLRQAFEIAGQEGGRIQARVERIQKDVSDLRAYTDALEEFLDESGTAQQLIEDFESDLESIQGTIESLESTVESNDEQVAAVSDEVSSLGDDVAEVSEEIDAVSDDVSDVESSVDEVEETVADVEGTVQEMEGGFDDVEATVEDFESTIADIEETVEDLEDRVSDVDVGDRLDDIESELEDLQTWQDQIKETFGG